MRVRGGINASIRWLKRHHALAKTIPEAIGGIGFSSGGHQLMLAAMRPKDSRYTAHALLDSGHDARLAFAVLCYAVLDPLARYHMVLAKQIQQLLDSHHAYWASESEMDEGNPQRILERNETVDMPPILAIQGDIDTNLTPEMANRFVNTYRNLGGQAEVLRYPSAPHGFISKEADSPPARDATARIVEFVHQHGLT